MANRYPGFVDRMIFFNTVAPTVVDRADWYAERGITAIPRESPHSVIVPGAAKESQAQQSCCSGCAKLLASDIIGQVGDEPIRFCKFSVLERLGKLHDCSGSHLSSMLLHLDRPERDTKYDREDAEYLGYVCPVGECHAREST